MLDALLLLKNLTSAVQSVLLSSPASANYLFLMLPVLYMDREQALSMGLTFESAFKYRNRAANRSTVS